MPRQARIDAPGLLQHVIARGNEKRDIFLDDQDRKLFVRRFSALLEETGTECFAWALINNHFHLLLRNHDCKLSIFMRRLLTSYVVNFNQRYDRSGHLFQNRYKSIVCDADSYLLELIRYIHLNPLRAGLVTDIDALDRYPWCGHAVLMGNHSLPGQIIADVLLLFGQQESTARRHYRQFVMQGVALGRRPELVGAARKRKQSEDTSRCEDDEQDDRILGNDSFADTVQKQYLTDAITLHTALPEIHTAICNLLHLDPDDLYRRSRGGLSSIARSLFCYTATRLANSSGAEVQQYLSLSSAGVSQAVRRGERIFREQPQLRTELEQSLDNG